MRLSASKILFLILFSLSKPPPPTERAGKVFFILYLCNFLAIAIFWHNLHSSGMVFGVIVFTAIGSRTLFLILVYPVAAINKDTPCKMRKQGMSLSYAEGRHLLPGVVFQKELSNE